MQAVLKERRYIQCETYTTKRESGSCVGLLGCAQKGSRVGCSAWDPFPFTGAVIKTRRSLSPLSGRNHGTKASDSYQFPPPEPFRFILSGDAQSSRSNQKGKSNGEDAGGSVCVRHDAGHLPAGPLQLALRERCSSMGERGVDHEATPPTSAHSRAPSIQPRDKSILLLMDSLLLNGPILHRLLWGNTLCL